MSKPISVRVEEERQSRWREGKDKMGIGSMSGYVKYCVDKVTNEVLSNGESNITTTMSKKDIDQLIETIKNNPRIPRRMFLASSEK